MDLKFKLINKKRVPVYLLPVTGKEAHKFYVTGIDENQVAFQQADVEEILDKKDSDELIGYIARDPNNKNDYWFIAKNYAERNYDIHNEEKMNFGEAIEAVKQGYRVARKGWNGENMFIFLVPGSKFKVNRAPLLGIYPEGTEIEYQSHIDMKTAQGTVVPWLASQSDMLADDWVIVGTVNEE